MIKLKSILMENVIDTPEFKRWFGNSKVVDKHGNPLVVYHGSYSKNIKIFDPDYRGKYQDEPMENRLVGIYFTPDLKNVNRYMGNEGVGYPVYLKIENPLKVTIDKSVGITKKQRDEILKNGYDGVIGGEGTSWHEIIVFSSNQIKSALGNRGNFDPSNPDITKEIYLS